MSDKQSSNDNIDRRQFIGASAALAASAMLPACRPSTPAVCCRTPPTRPSLAGELGVSAANIRQIIARAMASGGDYCDLFFQLRTQNRLSLEDHAVNSASSTSEMGLGVRVVKGVETGYAYTESLDRDAMLKAAEVASAVAGAPKGAKPKPIRVDEFFPAKTPSYYPVKQPFRLVETRDKVALLMKLHDRVAERDKRIKKVNISYRDVDSQVQVIDSDGRSFRDDQPMVVCYVSCMAEDKGRRESNYAGRAARAGMELFDDALVDSFTKEAVDRTVVLFDAVAGPVGELPVVLCAGSSGILLHEAIGHGMEADFARKNTTIYADKIGKRIAPKFVTIVDDGTNPNLRGSINFDDEGSASQRTVLVEDGVLRTFLHDRISARHFKLGPTGNGRRQSFRHMPIPRMRNTYMVGGPHKHDEIIGSIKKGIYAEHFTNGQVNIGPGDFTFYVKNGYLIEEGKLTRPIKDVNIIGNGPEVLERVTMVGDDFKLDQGGWTCGKRGQGVPVGLGMPTVAVSAITVGGTNKG